MPITHYPEFPPVDVNCPGLTTESTASVEKGLTYCDTDPHSADSPDSYPDGGLTAWLVVFSCLILNFNMLGITYAFGKTRVYQAHYSLHQFPNESVELIAFIGSSCTALTLTTGIPVGRWIDTYGFRKVTLVGSPAQWFLKRRSLSIGILSAGAGLGGIFWSFFIRAIIAKLGYQWALWLSGCISAFTNAIALLFLKTRPTAPNQPRVSFWTGVKMFKNPKFVTLYCASGVYMVPYFYVSTYAETQLNSTPFVGSILIAVVDLGMTLGRVALGFAADSKLGALNSVVIAMALAGIAQFALWLPSSNSLPLLVYRLGGGPIAGAILSRGGGQWTFVIVYSGITLLCGSLFAVATRFQVNRRILVTI
ncbi:major facilitator superfamily domain-containing protein [Hysterangium stoloniferum]|nr:major facilitator superfamily domain-containing protein [Hysterangium stoloniferum]